MIDANSKANRFLEAIEKYAAEQRLEMKAEVEAFREEQLQAANEEGTAAAFAFIQEQKQEFKASLAKETALKETKIKRELFEKRQKMAQQIFDEAEQKLRDFTTTPKYKEYISTSAKMMLNRLEGESVIVLICSKDKKYENVIKKIFPDCTVKVDNSIKIGGIRCECPNLSIIIDDTLDAKFEDRKRVFVETSGLIIDM